MCACTCGCPQRSKGYRVILRENDKQVWPIQLGCLCHLQELQGLTIMFLVLGEYLNLFHYCITSQDLVCVLIIPCEVLPFILFLMPAFKVGVISAPLSKSMKPCLDSSKQILQSRAVSLSLIHSVGRDSVCQPCLSKQTDMWLNVVISGCVMWSQIILFPRIYV